MAASIFDDARRYLTLRASGWTDPEVDPYEMIGEVVDTVARERETLRDDIGDVIDNLRVELKALSIDVSALADIVKQIDALQEVLDSAIPSPDARRTRPASAPAKTEPASKPKPRARRTRAKKGTSS